MFIPFHDNNPTRRFPVATVVLIGINALAFLLTWMLPWADQNLAYFHYGFVPARMGQFVDGQPIRFELQIGPEEPGGLGRRRGPGAEDANQAIFVELSPNRLKIASTLLSCMFMHGGWMHLIGNMWFLWLFGNNVEDRIGWPSFLAFYLVGGLVATACHWITGPLSTTPVVGASGAVSTMLGAYLITWPKARIRALWMLGVITTVEVPAMLVLGVWFLQQLLEGFNVFRLGLNGGVAWWAHIGGFLAGVAMMPLIRKLVGDSSQGLMEGIWDDPGRISPPAPRRDW